MGKLIKGFLLKYLYTLFFSLFFIGCSYFEKHTATPIYDLENIPQDISYFTEKIDFNSSIYETKQDYKKLYFSVWDTYDINKSLDNIMWPFSVFRIENSYGENLQPIKQDFFDEMFYSSNFDTYLTIKKKAITNKLSDVRALPTMRPLFRNPSQAGEGFPFDYLQNSSIAANKPVFVSHYSKDKEWVFIFSSFTIGWLKSDDIIFLEDADSSLWKNLQEVFLIDENIPIYDDKGDFLYKSRIGMMLPLIREDENSFTLLSANRYKYNNKSFNKINVPKSIVSKTVLEFNQKNLNHIINEVSKTNYGWGGIYSQRDCSSAIRDIFLPFGIWLPRNSFEQSKIGEVINLNGLSDQEKIEIIKQRAVAFKTLLYKKGHILLYVGTHENNVIVYHNVWGIKTKKNGVKGRKIIGRAIFSTLQLGKKQINYDKNEELLKNIVSLNILN